MFLHGHKEKGKSINLRHFSSNIQQCSLFSLKLFPSLKILVHSLLNGEDSIHCLLLSCRPRFIHACVTWWWNKYKCLDKYIQKGQLDTHVKCHPPKQSAWLALGITEWGQVGLKGCLNPTQSTGVAIGNHCNICLLLTFQIPTNLKKVYTFKSTLVHQLHKILTSKASFDAILFYFSPEILFPLLPILKDSAEVHMQYQKLIKSFRRQQGFAIFWVLSLH